MRHPDIGDDDIGAPDLQDLARSRRGFNGAYDRSIVLKQDFSCAPGGGVIFNQQHPRTLQGVGLSGALAQRRFRAAERMPGDLTRKSRGSSQVAGCA